MVKFDSALAGSGLLIFNLVFRVLQFLVGLTMVAIYASQYSYVEWQRWPAIHSKFPLAVATGAISMVTALVFSIVPCFVDYWYIAACCVWEFIVMALNAATFGDFRSLFQVGTGGEQYYEDLYNKYGVSKSKIQLMQGADWLDLVGMLLWLITFIFGAVYLVIRRRR